MKNSILEVVEFIVARADYRFVTTNALEKKSGFIWRENRDFRDQVKKECADCECPILSLYAEIPPTSVMRTGGYWAIIPTHENYQAYAHRRESDLAKEFRKRADESLEIKDKRFFINLAREHERIAARIGVPDPNRHDEVLDAIRYSNNGNTLIS